jgi:hypothetical protein
LKLKGNIRFWLLATLTLFLTAFLCWINLSEFIEVGLNKKTGGYPFGGEGPVPWYYKTAELYAKVNLVFGLLFLSVFFIALWTIFKRKQLGTIIVLLTTLFIATVMLCI